MTHGEETLIINAQKSRIFSNWKRTTTIWSMPINAKAYVLCKKSSQKGYCWTKNLLFNPTYLFVMLFYDIICETLDERTDTIL